MSLLRRLEYYLWATYRRKLLDAAQTERSEVFSGVVYDIGGRDRGRFIKPRDRTERWVFIDIEDTWKPDIVADVTAMPQVPSESADTVLAAELFEHVDHPEQGLRECRRVLRPGGRLVLSMPFLYPVHGDPYDFQRWTDAKWRQELEAAGYIVEEEVVLGRYFTVLGDHLKAFFQVFPRIIRPLFWITYPLIDLLVLLDRTPLARRAPLRNFHGGYLIIARRS